MLYTKKGDKGTTSLYHCDQRLSKSSAMAEALGAVDEINSLLGWCKIEAGKVDLTIDRVKVGKILGQIQQDLFIVQAELAGAKKRIIKSKVARLEKIIAQVEKIIPPIKAFSVAGGTSLSALLDFARATARRAERRVVAVANEDNGIKIGDQALAYMNRLSSLLFALARLANHKSGIKEEQPRY